MRKNINRRRLPKFYLLPHTTRCVSRRLWRIRRGLLNLTKSYPRKAEPAKIPSNFRLSAFNFCWPFWLFLKFRFCVVARRSRGHIGGIQLVPPDPPPLQTFLSVHKHVSNLFWNWIHWNKNPIYLQLIFLSEKRFPGNLNLFFNWKCRSFLL